MSERKFWEMDRDGRIWWGKDGGNVPAPKIYLSEVKKGVTPQTMWFYQEVGHNQSAKKHLVALLPDVEDLFITPKPEELIKRSLQVAALPRAPESEPEPAPPGRRKQARRLESAAALPLFERAE